MESEKWKNIKAAFSEVYELPADSRPELMAALPADIQEEVRNLLEAHEEADDFIAEPFLLQNDLVTDEIRGNRIGKQIDDYLVLEKLGSGGMGTVYLAERQNSDFKQKVALKLIKRGMDSEAILGRFAVERRILSSLDHPNIARLLDGGISSEGVPYFVMEFVDGKPLNQFLRENQLSLEDRLGIFRAICAAVENAHKNLIVHRDLKPSNILVTGDRTPKLLDFGIAKLLSYDDATATNTATRGRVFTPEYASPEQIRGDAVTTAADVYSLGVILYELLTQHRPYEVKGKSFDEIYKSICETEPPKPSDSRENQNFTEDREPEMPQIPKRRLRGDLDNIVLMAIRKDPADRYGSVHQLSDDISRFLRGLPVLAQPQTFGYRVGKYVKRHKIGVSAAALVLISLVAGVSVATWQAIVARNERAKAERRFNDVRKLSNSFLFEFHDAIKDLEGATPARKLVIERALPFLDSLAEESEEDESLQNELAESYRKLGVIQGHPFLPNVGDVAGAIESFRKSIKIGEKLTRLNPANQEYQLNLANYHDMLGDMYNGASYDTPNALANYQAALKLREELRIQNADDLIILKSLSISYQRVGAIKAKTGELSAAIKDFQDSLEISERLQALQPANNKLQLNISIGYYKIGEALHTGGKYREALEQYEKGRTIINNLMAVESNNADLPRMIGIFDGLSANAHVELGEIEEATMRSNNSLAVREKLYAADQTNTMVFGDLTLSLDTVGDLLVRAGDVAGAMKLLRRSLAMREAALKQDPTMTLAKRYIAISHNKIASAFRSQNALNAALAEQKLALTISRELSVGDPTNLELRRELAVSLQGAGEIMGLIAVVERNREKWSEARSLLAESRDIYSVMKANNRSFGADDAKITNLSSFLEKHERSFSR